MQTKYGSVGDGWKQLVEPLIKICEQNGVKPVQIKEKFGTLRFYVDRCSDLDPIISAVEGASAYYCEDCGIGKHGGRWVKADGTIFTPFKYPINTEDEAVTWEKSQVETRPTKGKYWTLTLCKRCRGEEPEEEAKKQEVEK